MWPVRGSEFRDLGFVIMGLGVYLTAQHEKRNKSNNGKMF